MKIQNAADDQNTDDEEFRQMKEDI